MKKLRLLYLLLFLPLFCFGQSSLKITKHPRPVPPSGGYYTLGEIGNRSFLKIDPQDNKWVGFRRIGLGKYNNGSWTIYNTQNSGLPSNMILCMDWEITNASTGNCVYYIGTAKGLVLWDGHSWNVINTSNSELPDDTVTAVKVVKDAVWVGTKKGACKYSGGNWTIYTKANGALPKDEVLSLEVDKAGTVYVGTTYGLAQSENGQWTHYFSHNSGLWNNPIYGLLADHHGSLWLQTKPVEKPNLGSFGVSSLYRLKDNKIESVERIYNGCNYSDLPYFISPMCLNKDGYLTVLGGPNYALLPNKFLAMVELLDGEIKSTRIQKQGSIGFNCLDADSKGLFWLFLNPDPNLTELDKSDYSKHRFYGLNDLYTRSLDINNVSANILTHGDMFWDLIDAPAYEVPKGSCKKALNASALWIGGYSGDSLHVAAQTYRQNGSDFFPGAIDTATLTVSPGSENWFDQIWKVDVFQIQEFREAYGRGEVSNGTYAIPEDILSWPAHGDYFQSRNLAPFEDTDGDGIYNPMKGDYPRIKGHQMLYWIFNDVAHDHLETKGHKLGVEVHACAYAYYCPDIKPGDSDEVLNYTTFYEYKVINRSDTTYRDTYLGVWSDVEIGNPHDDLVGVDTARNMIYSYNGRNYDALESGGYGENPPMVSHVFLDGPSADANDRSDNNNDGMVDEPGERCLTKMGMVYENNSTATGNPEKLSDYYSLLTGIWKNGCCFSYNASVPRYFSGNPSDKRFVASAGPFTMEAGETNWLRYAIVYSRDEKNPNGMNTSIALNQHSVERVTQWYKTGKFPACVQEPVSIAEETPSVGLALQLYPNPSSGQIFLGYSPRSAVVKVIITDISGRELQQVALPSGKNAGIDVSGLAAGMYLLRVQDGDKIGTASFVKE